MLTTKEVCLVMSKKNNKLTDSDWVLLKALWDKPPQMMRDIVQFVKETNIGIEWSYKTYYTYLNNLCTKGFAAYKIRNAKSDRLYYALITRKQAMKMESDSVLARVSGSGVFRLIATMAESDRLTDEDQQKLMELVSKLEQEGQES